MAKPFWKYPMIGKTHEFAVYWAETALGEKALNEKKTLTAFNQGGTLKEDVAAESLVNELLMSHNGLRVVHHKLPDTYTKGHEWMLAGPELAINIDFTTKNRSTTINVFGLDEGVVKALQVRLKERMTRKVTKGRVYVVVQGSEGPYLHEMGTAGEDFEPTNYRPDTVTEYRHIAADLNSDDPCGRIIILDGPPGTGKTHMVRALLNEAPKATFILVPSNMMSELGNPSFIKALLREQKKGYPMVLIIEDADEAISSRKADNISAISALLNFSDGIFGAMMDLRVVCTTNADVKDLDEAVMRAGRLCRRIEVGKLDHDQAEAVYKRLGGTEVGRYTKGNFYSLGDIYRDARGSGGTATVTPKKAKGRLGFQLDVEESPEPVQTPADELGLRPGDVVSTNEGDVVKVRDDGQLEMVKQGPSKKMVVQMPWGLEEYGGDDDDLIDEDPEDSDPDDDSDDDEE